MPIDYTQLRTEIQTDPTALGYAAHVTSGSDTAIADILNAVRTGINIGRDIIPSYEIWEAIVPSEWNALLATQQTMIGYILGMGQVNVKGTNTRAAFANAFGAGTTTRGNLVALQDRKGSRAEQLFGAGTVVTHDDVAKALRG